MIAEATQAIFEVAKLVLLPAIGFCAGFAAQWLLQERKSRDELLRALAERRADALCRLWELTTLPAELATLEGHDSVSGAPREQMDRAILDWYTKQAGAIYLSWPATQQLFLLLDCLRAVAPRKIDLEQAVSALRSRLKFDCGIYSRAQARRQLTRPRPSTWTADVSRDRKD